MRRHHILPLVTLGLLFLVLADRALEATRRRLAAAEPVANETRSAIPNLGHKGTSAATHAPTRAPAASAGEVRLARLAAREALTREANSTYLDSLILSTDSVVRRWPDRWGTPIRVALVEGGVPNWSPRLADYVRTSLDRWESLGIGVRFEIVTDTSKAEILVRWIDHFDFDRAGQTDLTWDQSGRVRRALVSLALRTNTGVVLPGRRAPLGGGPRDGARHRPAALGRLQRRHVPCHPHRYALRSRPTDRGGPLSAATGSRPRPDGRGTVGHLHRRRRLSANPRDPAFEPIALGSDPGDGSPS